MLSKRVRLHISAVFFSSLSDLMKFTEVDESLSTTSTTVLFQRKPTCFRIPCSFTGEANTRFLVRVKHVMLQIYDEKGDIR